MWKNCAAVEGTQTWMLCSAQSCRKRSSRADECSGPCPSKPCGRYIVSPHMRPHFASPEAMNWSITTWAPLTKSPNCASQMTSS